MCCVHVFTGLPWMPTVNGGIIKSGLQTVAHQTVLHMKDMWYNRHGYVRLNPVYQTQTEVSHQTVLVKHVTIHVHFHHKARKSSVSDTSSCDTVIEVLHYQQIHAPVIKYIIYSTYRLHASSSMSHRALLA